MKYLGVLAMTVALAAGSVACGGGSGNSQLKRRVTYQHLAPMTAAERAHEADVYRDVFLAEWQVTYTKSQVSAAELEIKIAKNDLASSKISKKSAGIEMKAAEETGELNKIDEMKVSERVAVLEIDMHKLNLDRAKKNLAYLKKRLAYEERVHRSREAELESVKANSMKAAGISPPDFDPAKYKAQHKDRAAQAKGMEAEVAQEKKELQEMDAQLAKAKQAIVSAKTGAKPTPVAPPAKMEPLAPVEPVIPEQPAPAPPAKEPAPVEPVPATPAPAEPTKLPAPKGN